MSTPYNEPAFPIQGSVAEHQFSGMTMRDYFAIHEPIDPNESIGKDLAEKLIGRQLPRNEDGSFDSLAVSIFWAEAEAAYRYMRADAMLKARQS